jgi:hypothetical protein
MNSIGTLYIECPYQENKNSFKVEKELSEDEYVKMLRDYSNTLNGSISFKSNRKTNLNVYDVDNSVDSKTNYVNSKVKIYDIKGKPCDINELYKIQDNGHGVLIMEFFEDEMNEMFYEEFKYWKVESMTINNNPDLDTERVVILPSKNLKLEIDYHMFFLSSCKIYCEYDNSKLAIIIQNLTEI